MVLRNLTQPFLEWLFPSIEVLKRQYQNVSFETNAIVQRTGIVVGSQGSGKSTSMSRIVEHGRAIYKPGDFVAARRPRYIGHFVFDFLEGIPVQFFYCDDITYTKPSDAEIELFFSIRHAMRDKAEMRWGMIVFTVGTHRFYGIPLPFRTSVDFQIWKDVPSNPYDRRLAKDFIGEEGVGFLMANKEKWLEDPRYKGYGVVTYGRAKVGILSLDFPHFDFFNCLPLQPPQLPEQVLREMV